MGVVSDSADCADQLPPEDKRRWRRWDFDAKEDLNQQADITMTMMRVSCGTMGMTVGAVSIKVRSDPTADYYRCGESRELD